MSTQLVERYESFSLAAYDRKVISGQFDFVYFETLPAGVTVGVNGEPHRVRQPGSIRSGVPGRDDIQVVEFLNTTGGALEVAALFGNGSFEISGQVSLIGSIALPSGAATAAKQDAGNASLVSIVDALAGNATEVPYLHRMGPGELLNLVDRKAISILNTSELYNITVVISGAPTYLQPGQGVSMEASKPGDVIATIQVSTSGGGEALISTLS